MAEPRRIKAIKAWLTGALASFGLVALLVIGACLGAPAGAWAALPQGNAVTDPTAILRNALPVEAPDLQELQHRLEATSDDLRAKRWTALVGAVRRSQSLLSSRRDTILQTFEAKDRSRAAALLMDLEAQLQSLASAAEAQQRDPFLAARREALGSIGEAEAMLVGPFPFEIPAEFAALPRLLGRATVKITTTQGDLTAVVDGYNAPLTAGAFVDLVQKVFYDGLSFTRAEDFYVLQSGDPEGPADGYIDPATKTERTIPLEIKVPGESAPFYNQTFEDLGLFKATPTLPFATLGTLGWAHSDEHLNDGSSQFFFFLYEAELTPAGLNLVDGRYAAFGYVVDGFDVLEQLGVDDAILRATVVEGADHLDAHG
ncbi:MAG: peptidylprolyl isomerase [Cyanobacteriota bacterium]